MKREIIQLQKEIDSLPVTRDTVQASSNILPYQKHAVVIEGVDSIRLQRLRKRLERRRDEYMDMVDEINDFIESIDDSMIRQLVAYRYLNHMSWNDIAANMGYRYTPDQLRKRLERFFQHYTDLSTLSDFPE